METIQGWRSFWDQQEAAIHRNSQLSTVDKFKYLIGYLVRKVQDTISGISLTGRNYQIAVDLLDELFHRKDLAFNNPMTRLRQLQAVDAAQDVGALQSLYYDAVNNFSIIEAGALQALLRLAIKKRLSYELVFWYCQQKHEEFDTRSTFSALLNFLKKDVRSREEATEIESDDSTVLNKLYDKARRHYVPSAAPVPPLHEWTKNSFISPVPKNTL